MVEGGVNGREFKPEQAVCAGKRRLDHPVKLKIRLQRGLIEIVQFAAALFRIVAPVPGLQPPVHAVGMHHRFKRLGIRFRGGPRGFPDLHQKITHRIRRAGHFGFQLEGGKAVIAQKPRAFFP